MSTTFNTELSPNLEPSSGLKRINGIWGSLIDRFSDASPFNRPITSKESCIEILPTQFLSQEDINNEQDSLRPLADRQLLLPEQLENDKGKLTLVLDLDETLIHSSFELTTSAKCALPVIVDGTRHVVYVSVRPGTYEFLKSIGEKFEVIVYTASLKTYADSMLKFLDKENIVKNILSRSSCFSPENASIGGNPGAVKDLSLINRPIERTILIDNSPHAASLFPENSIIVKDYLGFINQENDDELMSLVPFLEKISEIDDIRPIMRHYKQFQSSGLNEYSEKSLCTKRLDTQSTINSIEVIRKSDMPQFLGKKGWRRAWHYLKTVRRDNFKSQQI
mmetsp:Transcript_12449/g.18688  ORF Transcript_12449/g.18688 Transcript_12449/m.18688 type:complete len:335 (+) Transcript_12449:147-1151(+)|eukprot:CAMPEP_0171459698 /NCGR_PEP_ID=MMETSP0945-20130129/4874_1 /TAXON_ID=109269 /ORGANISM="Vaucheria litorea, Strain CCMP2940" /LENGTH=334 /DNA_ID=CAMNT_0011985761 /DNA_START=130 /DNA_END=1134 /DNA_ORIENTATION=-